MDRYLILFRGKSILIKNFILSFQETVRKCWSRPAPAQLTRTDESCAALAGRIAILQTALAEAGLQPGDHIAINTRDRRDRDMIFMAASAAGYVSVLTPEDAGAADTMVIARQSGCKVLFTETHIYKGIESEHMPLLSGVIDSRTLECLDGTDEFLTIYDNREYLFKTRYPQGIRPSDISYRGMNFTDTCAIRYTIPQGGGFQSSRISVEEVSCRSYSFQNRTELSNFGEYQNDRTDETENRCHDGLPDGIGSMPQPNDLLRRASLPQ